MQCAGDQFLAGARFASDEHRYMRLRQAANRAEHVLHRRGFAEHFAFARRRRFFGRNGLSDRNCAADQCQRLIDVKRLRQILKRAALKRLHGGVEIRERGHHNHRHLRMRGLDFFQQR